MAEPDSDSVHSGARALPWLFGGFRSFRTRLLVFLLALLLPVLAGILYYVNRNNSEYTEETINSYLRLGADVFDYTRQQQALTLQAMTNSLTWDFGFRTAFAADDPATLFDAALNVLDRSMGSADMLMIVDLDYRVIIDTARQEMEALPDSWRRLIAAADADEDLRAEAVLTVHGQPYQLIALPLYLPRQVAWIIGGFALDSEFVTRVKETTLSDVSVLLRRRPQPPQVLATTLPAGEQLRLAQQLRLDSETSTAPQRIQLGEEEYSTLLRSLYASADGSEEVFAVIQRSYAENNANVLAFRQLLFRFYAVVLGLSLLATVLLARSVSRPLLRLNQMVARIRQGDYSLRVPSSSRDELGALANSVNAMARGLKEKEQVRDLLGKVVSPQIADELLRNPVELGGEERTVSMLFADIRGFTGFCERLSPARALESLNEVLTVISEIIEQHQGVVDKYQGDAVMALFGAPVTSEQDARQAVAAGLAIVSALERLQSELDASVGINTGLVVAGNLGSPNRLNYSVIGDAVNLAARLEALTRFYGVKQLVSESTRLAAPGFEYRELDRVQVAGKSEAITVFEVLGPGGCLGDPEKEQLQLWRSALSSYRAQDWDAAAAAFSSLRGTCDNPRAIQIYLDRISAFRAEPPGPSWRGEHVFDKK